MSIPATSTMPRPTVLEFAIERIIGSWPTFVGARSIAAALRLSGARIGSSSIFWGAPKLVGASSSLEVGELCGLNFGCYFELDAPITLADHVSVGHEVMFLTRTHDRNDSARRGKASGALPIRVGEGSWLGSRSVILPGVTIGAGSVVGASCIVRDNVPPNTLLAGSRRISLAKWRS